MLCLRCNKNQAKHYTYVRDGKEKTLDVCPECYEELYGDKPDFFTSFLEGTKRREDKPCPVCGATMEEFQSTGLLGCAYCYEAFRTELTDTVRYIQGSATHAGSQPKTVTDERYDELRELANRRAKLREQLDRAVREGRFAEVDGLQAQLKEINHKLNSRGGR